MKKVILLLSILFAVNVMALPATKVLLYNIENNAVKYKESVIAGADKESFQILPGRDYAKDKNNVYYHEVIIENADKETFEVLNVSVGEEIIFKIIGYARDKDKIYRRGEKEKIVKETSEYIIVESGSCFIKKDNVNMSLSSSGCKE